MPRSLVRLPDEPEVGRLTGLVDRVHHLAGASPSRSCSTGWPAAAGWRPTSNTRAGLEPRLPVEVGEQAVVVVRDRDGGGARIQLVDRRDLLVVPVVLGVHAERARLHAHRHVARHQADARLRPLAGPLAGDADDPVVVVARIESVPGVFLRHQVVVEHQVPAVGHRDAAGQHRGRLALLERVEQAGDATRGHADAVQAVFQAVEFADDGIRNDHGVAAGELGQRIGSLMRTLVSAR